MAVRGEALGDDVQALRWDAFAPWFARKWQPGDHIALIGPTKVGKSTTAVGILPLRKYVLAFDPKGGDSTLRALASKGFQRVPTWPPPKKLLKQVERGEPTRLIVGPAVRTTEDLPKLRATFAAALRDVFDQGGWTLYVDELQIAADRRLMNLTGSIEQILIAARDKGVSMVTSFQRPANVPRSAADQATFIFVFYTRDTDVVNRIAEMVGRPRPEIRGAVRGLSPHTFLVFSRDPRAPIIISQAPKV